MYRVGHFQKGMNLDWHITYIFIVQIINPLLFSLPLLKAGREHQTEYDRKIDDGHVDDDG